MAPFQGSHRWPTPLLANKREGLASRQGGASEDNQTIPDAFRRSWAHSDTHHKDKQEEEHHEDQEAKAPPRNQDLVRTPPCSF
jgi:hypothetical protein